MPRTIKQVDMTKPVHLLRTCESCGMQYAVVKLVSGNPADVKDKEKAVVRKDDPRKEGTRCPHCGEFSSAALAFHFPNGITDGIHREVVWNLRERSCAIPYQLLGWTVCLWFAWIFSTPLMSFYLEHIPKGDLGDFGRRVVIHFAVFSAIWWGGMLLLGVWGGTFLQIFNVPFIALLIGHYTGHEDPFRFFATTAALAIPALAIAIAPFLFRILFTAVVRVRWLGVILVSLFMAWSAYLGNRFWASRAEFADFQSDESKAAFWLLSFTVLVALPLLVLVVSGLLVRLRSARIATLLGNNPLAELKSACAEIESDELIEISDGISLLGDQIAASIEPALLKTRWFFWAGPFSCWRQVWDSKSRCTQLTAFTCLKF